MARTHTFKGGCDKWGCGYFAYIEDGQLVIGESWDREGGILYKGSYETATSYITMLYVKAPKLWKSITEYYEENSKKKESAEAYYVRHRFKDSRDPYGNGYSGYVNVDGLLIIEQDDPRGGGVRFEGRYEDMSPALADLLVELRAHDPVLYGDIEKWFAVRKCEATEKKPKVKYKFKDSRDSYGNGYSGYLDENHDLVLVYNVSCYHDVYYRGPYATAGHQLGELRSRDKVLYDDIEKYFTKHGVKDESDRKDLGGSKETKYTVRLFLNNGKEIVAVIPGTSETDVIRKIMLPVPATVIMYDLEGRTMAVRSDKIYTVAILG
jgi:hypothetical protein